MASLPLISWRTTLSMTPSSTRGWRRLGIFIPLLCRDCLLGHGFHGRFDGQREAEGRAFAFDALDGDGAVMGIHEGLHDGEAQAHAIAARVGLEHLEHLA